jgi:flagellar motility protein MotE (MotC chaperone)
VNLKFLPFLALLAFAAAPVVIGSAGETKKDDTTKGASADTSSDASATDAKTGDAKKAAEEKPKRKLSSECIASEEVIADLEAREEKLKQREEALKEHEKEVAAQEASVKEEVSKIEQKRADLQSTHEKELAAHEEQVNKLIETFEGMSPKAAAGVMAGIDDELAVLALGKLTSVKAGKILANLKPEKSAHLSEMMAYGKTKANGKETKHGESDDRTPASTKH